MPRTVEKPEALELLEQDRRELLGDTGGCVMCALVPRARARGEVLASSAQGVALLDRFGSRPGHVLVVSKSHLEDTSELGWPVYADLQRLAYDACTALRRTLEPARIFVAVLGASAQLPMSFPHFHIHVLPVYDTDERARPANVFSWSSGVLVYEDDEARALSARLRAAWPAHGATESGWNGSGERRPQRAP
jgi:diadenosine tetraphosphate (Ap4A) HIT family hydrolase